MVFWARVPGSWMLLFQSLSSFLRPEIQPWLPERFEELSFLHLYTGNTWQDEDLKIILVDIVSFCYNCFIKQYQRAPRAVYSWKEYKKRLYSNYIWELFRRNAFLLFVCRLFWKHTLCPDINYKRWKLLLRCLFSYGFDFHIVHNYNRHALQIWIIVKSCWYHLVLGAIPPKISSIYIKTLKEI